MADKLNYKVGMIGALDMLRFKNMPKVREKAIQAASSAPLPKTLTTNEKAKQRHPEKQEVIVAEIRQNGADAKTIVLKTEDGSALAPFRAGQYISVCVPIGGTVTTRSYSLCSSPAWAKRGEYNITVKRDDAGFVSPTFRITGSLGSMSRSPARRGIFTMNACATRRRSSLSRVDPASRRSWAWPTPYATALRILT